MQELVNAAPKLIDYLGEDSLAFLKTLEKGLTSLSIDYVINPRLVRGLDYYNHTVFEWTTEKLGAQGTICGGGRYDPLIEMLGGRPTPAVGFAMGAERVIELMKEEGKVVTSPLAQVYVMHQGGETEVKARLLAETLRDKGAKVICHAGSTSFKSQMKRADASLATWAVIVGEEELAQGEVTVKHLRNEKGEQVFEEQKRIAANEIETILALS